MEKIEAHKVTKPIQLLAAWLIGLVAVNGSFLATAASISNPGWLKCLLVIAAVSNVPLFLVAIFILQTKFRPELQEDSFYSQYLDKKTNQPISINRTDIVYNKLLAKLEESRLANGGPIEKDPENESAFQWTKWKVALNEKLVDFMKIRIALKQNNIPLETIFGKDNLEIRVVSINRIMDFSHILKLLRTLSMFEFDAILFGIQFVKLNLKMLTLGRTGMKVNVELSLGKNLKSLLQAT